MTIITALMPEVAHAVLMVAWLLSLTQLVVLATERWHRRADVAVWARQLHVSVWVLISISLLMLIISFLRDDFSVVYVAQHSHRALPLFYKVCALWGGHEGSMLLWVWMQSLWAWRVDRGLKRANHELRSQVQQLFSGLLVAWLTFLLWTSSPWLRWLPNIPTDGADLNPLLQDPGMALHPPMLYAGYVGASVPFVFALVALWRGEFPRAWAQQLRRWVAWSWSFLTVGMVLGSWWAYRELGWGGWWFWDPVENASLMPWLAQAALIHCLMVLAKRGAFVRWTLILGLMCFVLSVLGAFIVRSGVLVSVHAFAVDPSRGLVLLALLGVWTLLSCFAMLRGGSVFQLSESWEPLSREGLLWLNNVLLISVLATVVVGTLYPLVLEVLRLGKISVGAPYYNALVGPIASLGMLAMVFAFESRWGQAWSLGPLYKALLPGGLLAAGIIDALDMGWRWSAWFGLLIPSALLASNCWYAWCHRETRSAWLPAWLSHSGLALVAMGAILASTYTVDRSLVMRVGERQVVAGLTVELLAMQGIRGPNYNSQRALMLINGHHQLFPEQRYYPSSKMSLAKTDTWIRPMSDVYVALGASPSAGTWGVRLYVKPGVRWLWCGGLIMALGGIIAARRRRAQV